MKNALRTATVGLLVAIALAGCSSSSSSSASGPSHDNFAFGQQVFSASNPANGDQTVAPNQVAYTATGKIVASDGFDPVKNGFDTANYGDLLPAGTGLDYTSSNNAPAELTPMTMKQMFGDAVCGDPECNLTPEAQAWMNQTNQAMAGGHCYGFSDAALQFFSGKADPATFGATTTPQLDVLHNTELQSFLAENWAYQTLPNVVKDRILADPNTVLNELMKVLTPHPSELYTLIIFMADGNGGHAVTPYAVEDNGNGRYHILIYDNNFPGVVRGIAVDTTTDTWTYTGGINPSDTHEVYKGDAQTKSIGLDPISPALGIQPWTFNGSGASGASGSSGSSGSTGSAASTTGLRESAPPFLVDYSTGTVYDDIYLDGGDLEHGHLLITNPSGQHVGYMNGTLVNTIPGAIIDRSTSNQDWAESREPDYFVPDGVQYTITVDGSSLAQADPTEDVGVVAPGYQAEVDNINLTPGETDTMTISADGSMVSYTSSVQQAPIITYGVSDATSNYDFAVGGDDVPANGQINVHLPSGGSGFTFSTSNTGSRTNHLSLLLDKEDDTGSHTFVHGSIGMADGDTATLNFGGWTDGQSMPLVVVHGSSTQTIQLSDQGSLSNFGNSGSSGSSGTSGSSGNS
jgi:hypothetical protein